MPSNYNPYASGSPPTTQSSFDAFNKQYLGLSGGDPAYWNRSVGQTGAQVTGAFGTQAQKVGLNNLFQMLLQQGRVDHRLLASAQAQNARSTQQQQGAARAGATRSGMQNSGLAAALQASIASAGANRAAGLNYQDISDSYKRNQENLGLLDQLVIQPQLGYGALGEQATDRQQRLKEKKIAAYASLGSFGLSNLFGGGK